MVHQEKKVFGIFGHALEEEGQSIFNWSHTLGGLINFHLFFKKSPSPPLPPPPLLISDKYQKYVQKSTVQITGNYLKRNVVDQRYPDIQLHGRYLVNVRLPDRETV